MDFTNVHPAFAGKGVIRPNNYTEKYESKMDTWH